MENNKLSVFTDGSCINNGKKNSFGAIGIFFSDNDEYNLGQSIDNNDNDSDNNSKTKITNQTMELLACIQALKIIKKKIDKKIIINLKIIYIHTDSMYVINSMTKWYKQWEKS